LAGGAGIPTADEAAHRIHVDTCYARPIILNWDEDQDVLGTARALVNRRERAGPITISMAVLGEAYLSILNDIEKGKIEEDRASDSIANLDRLIARRRLVLCGLGEANPLRAAHELKSDDDRLDDADSLITACALACSTCDTFYTNDPRILYSRVVQEKAREAGLRISEAPTGRD
jgi:hypothetical protein